jgi:hypothetical protein
MRQAVVTPQLVYKFIAARFHPIKELDPKVFSADFVGSLQA